jgi:hypothetical protein
LRLQKSPSRIFGQNSGNSVDISKAFFEMGIWKFESSQVELAVQLAKILRMAAGKLGMSSPHCRAEVAVQSDLSPFFHPAMSRRAT